MAANFGPELDPLDRPPQGVPPTVPRILAPIVAFVDRRLSLEDELEILTGTPQTHEVSALERTAEVLSVMIPFRR